MTLKFEDFEINPIHTSDAWKLCDLMVANADRFMRFFPGTLAKNANPNLSKLFVDQKAKQFINKEEFVFTIKHSETRELAGIIYIKELDWAKKQGEFAYALGYTFKGQGLTTKAIKVLSTYAFNDLDLETLQIVAHKSNTASVNVALNSNFKWVRTLPNEFKPTGEIPLDMELYELYK